MNRAAIWAWAVAVVALAWAPLALAAAHVQFIDTGTPKSGALVMDGWRGVIVRISLDGGLPITAVHLGDTVGLGIYGNIAERWTDPQGGGIYTETSPGPLAANNSGDSDFNFDTHFLATEGVAFSQAQEGIGSGLPLVTARSPISSTPSVGYGATLPERVIIRDPFLLSFGGRLFGGLQVPPPR